MRALLRGCSHCLSLGCRALVRFPAARQQLMLLLLPLLARVLLGPPFVPSRRLRGSTPEVSLRPQPDQGGQESNAVWA